MARINFKYIQALGIIGLLQYAPYSLAANLNNCSFNGKPLYGNVQIVDSFPDVKVQVVNAFADIKVKSVSYPSEQCGEWRIVSAFPDVKVQFVEAFPDVKVQFINAFPGLGN